MLLNEVMPRMSVEESAQNIKNARIIDLGFSRWETSWSRPSLSNQYFETFLARPRGIATPFSFILKALRPEYCGSTFGVALIERERAIGSIDSPYIQPLVEHAYTRRVSKTQATRGYLVYPRFQGHTLAKYLRQNKATTSLLEHVRQTLSKASDSLAEHGWAVSKLTAAQIFVSFTNDEELETPASVMLIDHSHAYRYITPGLFTENFQSDTLDASFDPRYLLPPETFYKPELHSDSTEAAIERLLKKSKVI